MNIYIYIHSVSRNNTSGDTYLNRQVNQVSMLAMTIIGEKCSSSGDRKCKGPEGPETGIYWVCIRSIKWPSWILCKSKACGKWQEIRSEGEHWWNHKDDTIQIKDFDLYFELYETPLDAFEQRISLAAEVRTDKEVPKEEAGGQSKVIAKVQMKVQGGLD